MTVRYTNSQSIKGSRSAIASAPACKYTVDSKTNSASCYPLLSGCCCCSMCVHQANPQQQVPPSSGQTHMWLSSKQQQAQHLHQQQAALLSARRQQQQHPAGVGCLVPQLAVAANHCLGKLHSSRSSSSRGLGVQVGNVSMTAISPCCTGLGLCPQHQDCRVRILHCTGSSYWYCANAAQPFLE